MPFFQHEETGICVQTFFGNKPPSRRFYEITEKQYKMWLANQATPNSKPKKETLCIYCGNQERTIDDTGRCESCRRDLYEIAVKCAILTKENNPPNSH